jgi:peptidyl-prolyl cis-trans isomerase C
MINVKQGIGRRLAALLFTAAFAAPAAAQVLVTVGDYPITGKALEEALSSSPFATQFPAMDEADQAYLRGDLLKRLVASRLLYLEARSQGLDGSDAFRRELAEYRTALLYRAAMDRLRAKITLPGETLQDLRATYQGDADALAAARSQLRGEAYREQRAGYLAGLRERAGLTIHDDRVAWGAAPDTVLAEGEGLTIRAGDLDTGAESDTPPGNGRLRELLEERIDLLLAARDAEAEGVDVGERLEAFREERLPALQMERMVREWIPGEGVVRDYYAAHQVLGTIPERRHVGQIVVATRAEAEALRGRILAGESLFELAREHSIDTYGREHAGDMGWLKAGTGMPSLEQALAELPDNRVSAVVESPKGFHLLMITDRRPGRQLAYEEARDRVSQALVAERMAAYFEELQSRYAVEWKLPLQQGATQ